MIGIFVHRSLSGAGDCTWLVVYNGAYDTQFSRRHELVIPYAPATHSRHFVTYVGSRVRNSIPEEIKRVNERSPFKFQFKKYFLSVE